MRGDSGRGKMDLSSARREGMGVSEEARDMRREDVGFGHILKN
jgi:hypothetical protein